MYKLLLQIQSCAIHQAALQAAIVVVVSISIADSEKADKITQNCFKNHLLNKLIDKNIY